MTDEPIHPPTEEECWAEFWEVMGRMLADLYQSGWRAECDPLPEAAEAA